MTDLKIRLRMAWAVIRGRSVMYRWHSTSTGMIPKTLGALSVENTGNLELAIGLVNEEGAGGIEEPTPVERDNPPPVADLRGDVATVLSGRRDPRSHRNATAAATTESRPIRR